MANQKYAGGTKLLSGFILGFILALLYLTLTSESGYYSLWTLFKYSSLVGAGLGLVYFVAYELTYSEHSSEKSISGGNSSPSYDNYIDTSGSTDSGSSGDSGGGGGE